MIPRPKIVNKLYGHFEINEATVLLVEPDNERIQSIATILAEHISSLCGIRLQIKCSTEVVTPNTISISRFGAKEELGREGYEILANPQHMQLRAPHPPGLFYAVQTLKQLLPPENKDMKKAQENLLRIPAIEIEDVPRFSWRGLLLDCSRHFMSKEFVKRYIDLLAYHKMNVLHWHLTDDQGWRIEIKKYPRLTEVGAWRTYNDNSVYGGFYSHEDIREIVAYAEKRYVNIVPEIELPGHALAALAAYPQFSCTGGPFKVTTDWDIFKEVYCAGKEEVFEFLQNVLTEVVDLFPGEYIHIGGDECLKDRWNACSDCQDRIVKEGLKDESELQSYFVQRIQRFLSSKGRRLVGWDEILEGGLASGATIQSWRGMEGASEAAAAGHDAIVSPTSHAYFDYDVKTLDLQTVYEFEPIPDGLLPEQTKHILGGECNMWSERAPEPFVDRRMFPRLLAMAEVLWSMKENKVYQNFHRRVKKHYAYLDGLGVKYGVERQMISVIPTFKENNEGCEVEIEAIQPGLDLHYTLDNSPPARQSHKYLSRLSIEKNTVIQAVGFSNGSQSSDVVQQAFKTGREVTNISLKKLAAPAFSANGASNEEADYTVDYNGAVERFWHAVAGEDLNAVIDLGRSRSIRKISSGYLQDSEHKIFLPLAVEYSVSDDGVDYEVLWATGHNVPLENKDSLVRRFCYEPKTLKGRFVRVRAISIGSCPEWHAASGNKAWTFMDKIIVD